MATTPAPRWLRGHGPILVCLALVLAGCLGTTTPREPSGTHAEWSHVDEAAWIVYSYGCGFCSADADQPEHAALVLYPGGQLLRFTYGTGPPDEGQENDTGLELAAGLEAWREAIEPIYAHDLYGKQDGWRFVVHAVDTDGLDDGDRSRVHTVLEKNLRHAMDPGEPDFSDITDYGGVKVQVGQRTAGEKQWDVHLNPFEHENDAWGSIIEQLQAVEKWMQEAS